MKTTKNIENWANGLKHIYTDDKDFIDAPMWYHKRNLMQTATGYGKKLNTGKKFGFNGRYYRVYCSIFSNAGSNYIIVKGETIYLT
jgi:hypothetical protein